MTIRISMNMIAVMLRGWDCTLNIQPHPGRVLSSAGFYPAPSRICISQIGADACCQNGNDSIIIRNCPLSLAFELVQNIFDCFNDWEQLAITLIRGARWNDLIATLGLFCTNPLVLFDANHAVLAMSERYGFGDVDAEWDFLLKYKMASRAAVEAGINRPRFREVLENGTGAYLTPSTGPNVPAYLTVSVSVEGKIRCFLSSVGCKAPFLPGEIDVLSALAAIMSATISRSFFPDGQPSFQDTNIFDECLSGNVDKAVLSRRLSYLGWDDNDSYTLYGLLFDKSQLTDNIIRAKTAFTNAAITPCSIVNNILVFFVNNTRAKKDVTIDHIWVIASQYNVPIVCSLPFSSIDNALFGMSQLSFLSDQNCAVNKLNSFSDYAVDFLLLSGNQKELFHACHPGVIQLLSCNPSKNEPYAKALEAYLRFDRSLSAAANALNVHKNTISYRISKALEISRINVDSSYERQYALLSFRLCHLIHSNDLS